MKLSKKLMLKLLREEYSKKINCFLDEVETRAKHSKTDGELIADACGLKVKNRAGFVYVIDSLEKDPETGEMFVYLIPPGEEDTNIPKTRSTSSLNDTKGRRSDIPQGDDEQYIYSSVNENEHEEEHREEDEAARKKEKKNKIKIKNSNDVISPSDKAKFKKQQKIDINAKTSEPKMVNGRYRITLKELESDYTL